MITPIELQLRNFLSYGNNITKVPLDFKEPTLIIGENHDVVINGEHDNNGAGKTSILNALSFCIYGKTVSSFRKIDDIINNINKKNLYAAVILNVDDTFYKIERWRKNKKMGGTAGNGVKVSTASTIDDLDKAKNIGISLFKTGVKWSEEFINQMLELSMEASGEGKILDTPLDELSPELNKKLLLLAGVLKELSTNPATKEAVKEIAKATGTTLVEIMEEIKPELDKVTDEALVLIKNVADKSARGATSTGVSVAQAVLAEIPWVGGIIDFFLALGKGYNSLMEVVKTLSDKG